MLALARSVHPQSINVVDSTNFGDSSMSKFIKGFLCLLVAGMLISTVNSDANAQAKAKSKADAKPAVKKESAKKGGVQIDPKLPIYRRSNDEVSGSIKSLGSDTMNNLMALWAEGFKKAYPNVRIEIEGKGSSTAPPALIAGTSNFGPMSRPMKSEEIDKFEARYGYKPTELPTSIDMLAVYVHKDNPIKGLSLEQVDAIFSSTRKSGHRDITSWGDLGLGGEWKNQPISLYGRNSASGTYGYFKEHALLNGDYKASVKEQPGSSSVVQGVASEKYAIGYSGIGYKTADVIAVPLKGKGQSDFIAAESQYAYSGEYPLARFLYVYINHKPGSQLDPLRREFIRYIFSQQGQADVVNDGYLPITARIHDRTMKALGLNGGLIN
jgi:phosphate transport system substrate-binding protein